MRRTRYAFGLFAFQFIALALFGGAPGGMIGGQVCKQALFKSSGALFFILFLPDTIVEVTLAFDFGILQ